MAPFKRLALALLVAACTTQPVERHPFPPDTHAVFPDEHARELVSQCSRISPGPIEGTWTPSDATLNELEIRLPAIFEAQRAQRWPQDDVVATDYYRQYGGLIIDGRRIVYVNGFHKRLIEDGALMSPREPTRTWRDYPMYVCDGGPIVFGVEYDPEVREFRNFAFNGAID